MPSSFRRRPSSIQSVTHSFLSSTFFLLKARVIALSSWALL